jgi:hypothetical protein
MFPAAVTSCETLPTGPLEHEVLAAFSAEAPCRRKANRPPGEEARTEAAKLLAGFGDDEVVVSLACYQALADDMGR